MDIFKSIIRDAKNSDIELITLQGFGEPLLDKSIFEKIRFVKNHGMRVTFNTNASLLNQDCSRKLIEAGLDEINISMDALSKEKYEKIRFPLDYETVRRNIDDFFNMREVFKAGVPEITMTYVLQDINADEARDFINYWKRRSDYLIVAFAINRAGRAEVSSRHSPHIRSRKRMNYNPCEYLWTSLYIQYDGTVALCCEDYEGMVTLGDVNKQRISEIWHGEKMEEMRNAHLSKKRSSAPLCSLCYRHINWINVN